MAKSLYYVICGLIVAANSIQLDDWQPVLQPELYDGGIKTIHHPRSPASSFSSLTHGISSQSHGNNDQCGIYKVGFTQDLYFQYIHYKTHVPEMKEFTLCFWSKFTNHSNDHPIFSYAIDGQPKAISSVVANTERSSYFSLAVEGHTFFRLNYPLRLNKWYHTCQSWNGKTGEWQIWVNAERVGRGFHNRLVGHVIPSGGLAITGQEQTQVGGGFQEGKEAPQGSGGMLGEVTMVQLYSVALTAGKAHRNHKHHHAHQYDKNGNQITTPPPTTPQPRPTLPTHPLLTAGQINPNIRINFAGGQPGQPQPQPQLIPGQNFNAQLLNGQFVGNLVTQQFLGQTQNRLQPQQLQVLSPQPQQPVQFLTETSAPLPNSGLVHPSLVNPANVQFIDTQLDTHQLFKRQNEKEAKFGDKIIKNKNAKRHSEAGINQEIKENKHKKRELYISGGALIDDGLDSNGGDGLDQSLLYGLAGIGENQPIIQEQKDKEDREPAEAEVRAVMNVCNGCDEEPFGKALVFGWRTVPKKLYSGAFYTPAIPQCKVF